MSFDALIFLFSFRRWRNIRVELIEFLICFEKGEDVLFIVKIKL